jgi:hypothetical protein
MQKVVGSSPIIRSIGGSHVQFQELREPRDGEEEDEEAAGSA